MKTALQRVQPQGAMGSGRDSIGLFLAVFVVVLMGWHRLLLDDGRGVFYRPNIIRRICLSMKIFAAPVLLLSLLFLPTGANAGLKDIGAYKSGTEVTQAQMDAMTVGKSTKDDVVAAVGRPNRREEIGGKEVWYYDFTKIRHFGGNVSESTVFEFDKAGKLADKYKTGNSAKTGNPLIDAAKGK